METNKKTGRATVERVRKQFVEEGLEEVWNPNRRRVCMNGGWTAMRKRIWWRPPVVRRRWILRLLEDRLVALGHVESVSHETVRRTLKKRTQAVVGKGGVLAGSSVGRFRGGDGRRTRGLPSPL